MEWTETPESSTLLRFGYETTTQILTIEFKNGGVYDYFDVPDGVYGEMNAAASKGQFITKNIKTRFRYARH